MGGQAGGGSSSGGSGSSTNRSVSGSSSGGGWSSAISSMGKNKGGGRSTLDVGNGDNVAAAGPGANFDEELAAMIQQILNQGLNDNSQYIPDDNEFQRRR